jgi:hypothetical protein
MIRARLGMGILGILIMLAPSVLAAAPAASQNDLVSIDGLWAGSWGGGSRPDGTVMQPVMAEMFIKQDHVEVAGFPGILKLHGSLQVDRAAKQLHIWPAAEPGEKSPPKTIDFSFELNGDSLTLHVGDNPAITFLRQQMSQTAAVNIAVELIVADELKESGDLVVKEYVKLRVGSIGATYFEPAPRTLKTKRATILIVGDSECKKVSLCEARSRFKRSNPVAVGNRLDNRPQPNQLYQLWSESGAPSPDDEAAYQTLAKTLRPGTLIFVLDAAENVPLP